MNPNDHIEDAAFEDFLKGEGDLARQLQGLPQPPLPEALSAAILARAAADLGDGARPGVSANDAVHGGAPVSPPAHHYLRRARVPLGLAASVVLALFVVRGLMPQAFAPEVREETVVQESPSPAVKMAEIAPLAEPAPPPPPSPVRVAVRPAPPMRAAAPSAPVAAMADAVVAAAPVEAPQPGLDAGEAQVKAITPEPLMTSRFSLAESSKYVIAPGPMARVANTSAPKALSYAAAPPAPVLAAPVLAAPEWLERMTEMLKAGQTKEAHAEWLKFRARYPDTGVPPELQRQLDTVN